MANPTELPELVGEFIEMSKKYLRQETLEPVKQLGRFIGYGFAGGLAFAVGTLLVGIAGMRWLVDALPNGPYWEGLGYVVAAVVLAIVGGLVVFAGSRGSVEGRRR